MRKTREMCCDCHLVHVVNYRKDKNGNIEQQCFRDDEATRKARKRAGISIVRIS
jgi:hypothetical protein